MILSDFRQYWEIDFNQPNNHGRIYDLVKAYYPSVASISPLADEMKSFESMYFSVKYPTLNVKYDRIAQHFEGLDIYKDKSQIQVKMESIVMPIVKYTFIQNFERYAHLAMQAGLVYNTSGEREDYKYSSIQNYNIKSNKSVSEVYGNQKDSTTHGDDTHTTSFGERSTTQSNSDSTSTDNTMNNGATNTSNYETSMENETPKLSSKATSDAIVSTTNSTTRGSGSVNEVEKAHENTDTSKYGDIVNTKDSYTNTFNETYEEIGDKSVRPTAEVILSEINAANYTRFLDAVYSDCILSLCENTVW